MKRLTSILTLLVLMLGMGMTVKAQTWDFAALDANDAELIEADQTGNWYHSTELKKDRYSYTKALNKEAVMANGQEIAYTKGLLLTIAAVSSTGEGNLRAGNDASNKRMWLAGNSVITIPNLKAGNQVTVSCMSSSKDVERGVNVTNITPVSGDFNSTKKGTEASTNVGTVTADGDVTLTMNGAMYIYMIKVEDSADDAEEGGGDTDDDPQTPTVNDYSTSANSMKNQALLTLTDGTTKYYNTESLSSIDFDGAKVTVLPVNTNGYTFDNQVQAIAFKKADTGQQGEVTNADGKVEITEYKGWLESAYVKFKKFEGAKTYNVYIKGGQYTDYKQIDTQLVRDYGTYGRADVVGLQADATYSIKVVPVDEAGKENNAAANEAKGLAVKGYSREGFAFMNGFVPGAYNDDGTLKTGAKVFYVTKNTAKTISTTVTGAEENPCVGIQSIIDAYQKGKDTTPITFRFIGLVEKDDLDGISSSAEGIQIKGKNANALMPITIEGIGDDATIRGFGFLVRSAKGVEFRNIGIMRCMDDGISLDTDNSNIWVHHTDQFYGKHGSGDHAKGDGAVDVKSDSKYVTVSYNRFWDTGKSNMFGMKSESGPNYISYDHNWFDHSDSRHPRVRTMSVHVWNNYFDNVAKYGVGATSGASVFVENNYFLKTKKPILSSKQGTDAQGSGTFSGEEGGMIKAFGNYFDKAAANFKYYTQKNAPTVGYDAYETANRTDQVPATEKTQSGGHAYNNFDTDAALMYKYTAVAAEEVPSVVTGFYGAGRMNHGDFTYTFKDNVGNDNTDSEYDTTLGGLLDNYKSSLVGIFGDENASSGEQGTGGGETPGGDNPGGDNPGGEQGGETPVPTPEGTILCWFTKTDSKNTTAVVITDPESAKSMFTLTSAKVATGVAEKTVNGVPYTTPLKMESDTQIDFTLTKKMKMTLYLSVSGKKIYVDGTKITATSDTYTQDLEEGKHTIKKGDTMNVYLIKLEPVE